MKIFIDSANKEEIRKWIAMGVVDGVTTNPTIMLQDKIYNVREGVKTISRLIEPKPLSVEVITNDLEDMFTQAMGLATIASNVVIKIPQVNQNGEPCYKVMSRLKNAKIKVNATIALSLGQVILSAKAGATYISLFTGRISDEGGNAFEVIKASVDWIEKWGYKSKILVGSIRGVGEILDAAKAGAHIVTIPPKFLNKMADHQYTRDTVRQFIGDAEKSIRIMGEQDEPA